MTLVEPEVQDDVHGNVQARERTRVDNGGGGAEGGARAMTRRGR